MQTKDAEIEVLDPPSPDDDLLPTMPAMNVSVPAVQEEEQPKKEIVSDETLIEVFTEVQDIARKDREEMDEYLSKFANMVFNEGDATTSSKEALVNLLKMKSDQADKMTKIADLMTRVKMKDRVQPGGPWLAANQTNNINIGDGGQKRALLAAINKARKEKK